MNTVSAYLIFICLNTAYEPCQTILVCYVGLWDKIMKKLKKTVGKLLPAGNFFFPYCKISLRNFRIAISIFFISVQNTEIPYG